MQTRLGAHTISLSFIRLNAIKTIRGRSQSVNATSQIACVHWKELERASPALSERIRADSASLFQFWISPLVSVGVRFCRSSQLPLPVPSDCCPQGRGPREAGRNNVDETTQTDTDGQKRRGTFYQEHRAQPGVDAPRPLRGCCIHRLRSPGFLFNH
jgi:hypothetical protein